LNKACDAIIFCRIKDNNYIFSIELKSNQTSEISMKFRNSQIFVGLVNGILKVHFNIEEGFEPINILFDRKIANKAITKRKPKDVEYFHQGLRRQDNLIQIHPFISQQNK